MTGRYALMQRQKRCAGGGRWESSRELGGCMFCTCHIVTDPPHLREHKVFVIDGNSIQIRFCRHCLAAVATDGRVEERTP